MEGYKYALVSLIINIAFTAWFLSYLFGLAKKNCKCALTWHRQALIAFLIINTLVVLADTVLSQRHKVLLTFVAAPVSVLYIVISLVYIYHLKNTQCDCSKDPARTTIEVFSWISVGLVGLYVILAILFLAFR